MTETGQDILIHQILPVGQLERNGYLDKNWKKELQIFQKLFPISLIIRIKCRMKI